jgi:hypothetical protein
MYNLVVELRDWAAAFATIALPVLALKWAPEFAERITAALKQQKHRDILQEFREYLGKVAEDVRAERDTFNEKGFGVELQEGVFEKATARFEQLETNVRFGILAYRDAIPCSGEPSIAHFSRYHKAEAMLETLRVWSTNQNGEWLQNAGRKVTQVVMWKHFEYFSNEISKIEAALCLDVSASEKAL